MDDHLGAVRSHQRKHNRAPDMKLIADELVQGLMRYLAQRPYQEVAQAMAALSQLKEAVEMVETGGHSPPVVVPMRPQD